MGIFSDEKWAKNGKLPSTASIVDALDRNALKVPPIQYRIITARIRKDGRRQTQSTDEDAVTDGLIELSWGGKLARFALQVKSSSTPKAVEVAILQAKAKATADNPPLIVVPYLSPERMEQLQESGVSGFDLCGNVIIVGGGLFIWNGGHPNFFPESRPIKNIYRGRASILVRSFLEKREFASLAELREFALCRMEPRFLVGGNTEGYGSEERKLTLSTASKVISALVEDRLVERTEIGVRLIDPGGLLFRLKAQFTKPQGSAIQGRTSLNPSECWCRLTAAMQDGRFKVATTGLGSAAHYDALAIEDRLNLSVNNAGLAIELLQITPTRAFPNVELTVATDEPPYFDCRYENKAVWASPIQTLLELSAGGPRERDAAQRLEAKLLASPGGWIG